MSDASFQLFRGMLIGANKIEALKALSVAEKVHEGVMRKDGVTPYIEHPMKVASMLFELGIQDDNILAAALLHDVVEDYDKDKSTSLLITLKSQFADEVIEAVMCLSKPKNYDNYTYYKGISENKIATIVKLADRTHNLSTLYTFSEEKKAKYIKETIDCIYPLIHHAQHTYYEWSYQVRMFDLWIESLVKNIEPYMEG